ncbi:MAG: electron transport complex subunit RsxC [Muribaculaceae bacterium]|nr:electron transport complex subunit RsxC [Muribaculaceae bacterium]
MRSTFKIGGIHPPGNKIADRSIELLPLPMTATLPLSQHIGVPAKPIVEKGEHVDRGQCVAENSAYISAGLHAPISGTVAAIEPTVLPSGKLCNAIIIKATQEEHDADTAVRELYWEKVNSRIPEFSLCDRYDKSEIIKLVSASGVVGLGGAAFPSHVKLASEKVTTIPELLILNGCECEPYLMCDDALMCAYARNIAVGIELMMKASGIKNAVIAIEDNKSEAIKAISAAIVSREGVALRVLKTKYPQGGEKQLVEAVTGRRIASGALPISVGVIVQNVATAFAVWQAVATGQPLIERVVTVSGDIPAEQRRNYMVAIGTPLAELPCERPPKCRSLLGGPMMGSPVVRYDASLMKGSSGLTILSGEGRKAPMQCVRCAICVEACPMGLEPYLLSTYGRLRMCDEAREHAVADCIECGICSYSCPSNRPLLDFIRVAKQRSRK